MPEKEKIKKSKKTNVKKDDKKKVTKKVTTKKKVVKKLDDYKKKVVTKTKKAEEGSKKLTGTKISKGKTRKLRIEEKFSGRHYCLGIGKRKTSVALVRVYNDGSGQFFVNNKKLDSYFFQPYLENILQPINLVGKRKDFDVTIKVTGGGFSSQADAVRHGFARALLDFDPELRSILKKSKLLTRDSRIKERKKPGLKRARRAPQFSKR